MTLAFDLGALNELADPRAAFDDARTWSTRVGVVSDDPGYQVVNRLRDWGIYGEDFIVRPGALGSLVRRRPELDMDRLVFIGLDAVVASDADHGWEWLAVREAAEAAGWSIAADVSGDRAETGGPGE